jgi:transcriptional regulator with XRE-family HTH domain
VKKPRDHGTPACYNHGPGPGVGPGCRCDDCREAKNAQARTVTRLRAYGQWNPDRAHVDATGTARRLQALVAVGWSQLELDTRLGMARAAVSRIARGASRQVTSATARAVRALYDELWDVTPPAGTPMQRHKADLARRTARRKGWVPPAAWDDDQIDDPDATPAEGWRRVGVRRPVDELLEDAADLEALGESPEQIAKRLGVNVRTLYRARRDDPRVAV